MATRLPTGALREHNSNVAGEILRTPWPAKGYLRWGEILASGGRTSGYGHIGSPGRGLLAGRHSRTRSAAAGSLSTWSALYTIKRTRCTQLSRAVRRIRGILMATPLPWLPVPPRLVKALMRVQWGHISSELPILQRTSQGTQINPEPGKNTFEIGIINEVFT